MKIGKAIEILNNAKNRELPATIKELDDALNLGIESLKLIDNLRFDGSPYYPDLLPGETDN